MKSRRRKLFEAQRLLRSWRPLPDRYLICRPHGGFNDTLVQASSAIRFAFRTRRRVIFDFAHEGSGVRIPAGEILRVRSRLAQRGLVLDRSRATPLASSLSWYPSDARNLTYQSAASLEGPRTASGNLLRLPPHDVAEDVVVHETWGGGDDHVLALKAFSLLPDRAEIVRHLVSTVPVPDFGTHLRYTDAQVPLEKSLKRLQSVVTGSLYIASDSEEAVEVAQRTLQSVSVVVLPQFRSSNSQGIHAAGLTFAKFHALMADIYILSSVKTFIPLQLVGSHNWISGIARIVQTLRGLPSLRRSFFGF